MDSREWVFGQLTVILRLGPYDDSEVDIVLKADNIPLGIPSLGITNEDHTTTITTAREASSAKRIVYWPRVTIYDPQRRKIIYEAVSDLLISAETNNDKTAGIFTLGPEIGMVPVWEIAEEVSKAIYIHTQGKNSLQTVEVVASTTAQFDSFIFTLNNIEMYVI